MKIYKRYIHQNLPLLCIYFYTIHVCCVYISIYTQHIYFHIYKIYTPKPPLPVYIFLYGTRMLCIYIDIYTTDVCERARVCEIVSVCCECVFIMTFIFHFWYLCISTGTSPSNVYSVCRCADLCRQKRERRRESLIKPWRARARAREMTREREREWERESEREWERERESERDVPAPATPCRVMPHRHPSLHYGTSY